jgi:hypothetical protein
MRYGCRCLAEPVDLSAATITGDPPNGEAACFGVRSLLPAFLPVGRSVTQERLGVQAEGEHEFDEFLFGAARVSGYPESHAKPASPGRPGLRGTSTDFVMSAVNASELEGGILA